MVAGCATIEGPESGLAAGKATGSFRLTDGLAQNMELLDRVATLPAPLNSVESLCGISGSYQWTNGTVQTTNLVAESKGLLRWQGIQTHRYGDDGKPTAPATDWIPEFPKRGKVWKRNSQTRLRKHGLNGTLGVSVSPDLFVVFDFSLSLAATVFS